MEGGELEHAGQGGESADDHPRLTDPRLPGQSGHVASSMQGLVEAIQEALPLRLPAYEGRVMTATIHD